MLPHDDDRRTYVCFAIIAIVPVLLAAAQVTVNAALERWVVMPGVRSALWPLFIANGIAAGALAAWAAVLLPGGKTTFNVVAAASAFVVGAAIYTVALVPCAIVAEFVA